MSSENVVGVVEEVADNGKGKGSHIRVNGLKYGIYDPADAGLNEIAAGTTVSFRFKTAEKSGIVYKNIQGRITTMADGAALTAAPVATATASTGKSGYRKNGEEGGFPIHPKAYERALDRRNAITVAARVVIANGGDEEAMFELASRIEAYTTGDTERDAEAKLAFHNDTVD